MNRLPFLLAALSLTVAAPALAEPPRDGRITTIRFNADAVVRIPLRQGIQAAITFSEEERIENVAIGDAVAWQVTPNKRANLVFLKPLAARAQTNMTVVTDRHTYLFDLIAGPAISPIYVLRFNYPDEPKLAAKRAGNPTLGQPAVTDEEAEAAAGAVKAGASDPASLNFAWKTKGKPALLPVRVYDDGQATFLAWSPRTPIPAIQIRNNSGAEGPVNYAVRDDVIVIDGVPGVIVLRYGRDVATLEREHRSPVPAGTPAPAPTPATAATPTASLAAAQPAEPKGK